MYIILRTGVPREVSVLWLKFDPMFDEVSMREIVYVNAASCQPDQTPILRQNITIKIHGYFDFRN